MNIAVLANLDKKIDITSMGGSEVFTYLLVSQLIKHDDVEHVEVFGVENDHFNHKKVIFNSILPTETRQFVQNNPKLAELHSTRPDFFSQLESNLAVLLYKKLSEKKVDIVHNNSTAAVFNTLSTLLQTPIISTMHVNAVSPSFTIPYHLGQLSSKNHYFVTIANHQKTYMKNQGYDNVTILKTIHNGIDVSHYPYLENTSANYGFWIGRVSSKHNKGLKEAVIATKSAGKTLKALATLDDRHYFDSEIKPELDSSIELLHEVKGTDVKSRYYGEAKYLLYPIMWEEPFGLIFLEAMASGTPVIAYARGAVPEIVKDGETGFIVNPAGDDRRGDFIVKKTGIEGLCEAMERIATMSEDDYVSMRKNCRTHVENNFTVSRMAREYIEVYKQVLGR